MKIGKIIKKLRGDITQAELAKKARLSFTTISKIEKGSLTGTIDTHRKIANALGISLSELYKGIEETEAPVLEVNLTKREQPEKFYYNEKVISQILLKQVSKHKMLPELLRLEKNGVTHLEQKSKGTEQFLFVLEGKIEMSMGEQVYQLKRGESIYFDASLPYRIKNKSNQRAKALRITTPVAL